MEPIKANLYTFDSAPLNFSPSLPRQIVVPITLEIAFSDTTSLSSRAITHLSAPGKGSPTTDTPIQYDPSLLEAAKSIETSGGTVTTVNRSNPDFFIEFSNEDLDAFLDKLENAPPYKKRIVSLGL